MTKLVHFFIAILCVRMAVGWWQDDPYATLVDVIGNTVCGAVYLVVGWWIWFLLDPDSPLNRQVK